LKNQGEQFQANGKRYLKKKIFTSTGEKGLNCRGVSLWPEKQDGQQKDRDANQVRKKLGPRERTPKGSSKPQCPGRRNYTRGDHRSPLKKRKA